MVDNSPNKKNLKKMQYIISTKKYDINVDVAFASKIKQQDQNKNDIKIRPIFKNAIHNNLI